jgi:hypothetical protein
LQLKVEEKVAMVGPPVPDQAKVKRKDHAVAQKPSYAVKGKVGPKFDGIAANKLAELRMTKFSAYHTAAGICGLSFELSDGQ